MKGFIGKVGVLAVLAVAAAATDLGTIEVTESGEERSAFSSVFEEQEYLQDRSYLEDAAAQKRLNREEAMFIPGVQGDPIKAIKSFGGVTALGDTSGELYIYGSKPEESLTTINHLPIGYLFHMGGLHSVIAPDAIEQIDAYLGGYDTTYGNAMGGVIDVTPKYPGRRFEGFGHIGIFDSSAGVSLPLGEKSAIFVGARRSYFDVYLNAVGEGEGDLDDDGEITYTQFPNYYDLTTMATYRLDAHNHFAFELITAGDALTINTQENVVKDPEATGEVDAQSGFTSAGLRWETDYDNYHGNTLLYYFTSFADSEFYDGYFVRFDYRQIGLFHESEYALGNHRLSAGFELRNYNVPIDANISVPCEVEDIDCDFTSAEKIAIHDEVDSTSLALFIQDIYSPHPAWQLRYGARYNISELLGSYVDLRLSAVYRIGDTQSVSLSAGRYSQQPEGYKNQKDLGNDNLGYERAWHGLFSYRWNFTSGSMFSVEPFYKRFEKLAINDEVLRYLNAGEGEAYGADISARLRWRNWYAYGAYTYLRSKRQIDTDNDRLYRFYGEVPHTVQLIGGYRFGDSWSLSALMKYHSGKPYTEVIGTYVDNGRIRPIYGEPFAARLDDYFTLNIKIAQQRRLRSGGVLEWSFELMNLTNRENITSIDYDDEYNKIGTNTQLPLLPWLDLTYRF